jgi:hypothetical protein
VITTLGRLRFRFAVICQMSPGKSRQICPSRNGRWPVNSFIRFDAALIGGSATGEYGECYGRRSAIAKAEGWSLPWINTGRLTHFEKPGEVWKLIERASPPPHFELFGRKSKVANWVVRGEEVERSEFRIACDRVALDNAAD